MDASKASLRKILKASLLVAAFALGSCATIPSTTGSSAAQSVSLTAANGSAGALMVTPAGSGPWPAVILFPDASGLRPAYASLAQRIADHGYAVLVPNVFYRSIALDGTAATAAPALSASEAMQRGMGWRQLATDDAVMADARAIASYLDSIPAVDHSRPIGALGFDIGGAHAFLAARALPERIATVAVSSPSAIATTRDNSPHLFVQQSRATYLVEIAGPDDEREPGDKTDLQTAFSTARLAGTVQVVPAAHGYAIEDNAAFDAGARDAFVTAAIALLDDRLK